jgi:hypothetical protein
MLRTLPHLLCILCAVFSAPAGAWENQWDAPAVQDTCATYDARYSEALLFRIIAKSRGQKVYLHSRKAACAESETNCATRMGVYLIDGDVVFGGPEDKSFRCVYYGTRKGTLIAGFVYAGNLVPRAEDEELTQDFLTGTWTHEGNPKIVITPVGKNKVRARGEAAWPGLGEQARHTGTFEAVAQVAGREITFREGDGEYDCKVVLLRRGPYLVANDNEHCGGLNVRFSDILMKLLNGK